MHQRNPDEVVLKAGIQSADDPFEFVLSDETVDRVGDVIRADGWDLSDFRKNPIALFGHDHEKVIGTWKNVRVQGKQLLGKLNLAKEGTSELVDTVRSLVEQRILKAVSVGFRVLDYDPINKDEPWGGWNITKALLMETSVVAVPANPNAIALAKACAKYPNAVEKLLVRADAADPVALSIDGRPAEDLKTPNLDKVRNIAESMGIDI
jgi:HK97 family phage prohead protease